MKTKVIRVRVATEELDRYLTAATYERRSLSSWVRLALDLELDRHDFRVGQGVPPVGQRESYAAKPAPPSEPGGVDVVASSGGAGASLLEDVTPPVDPHFKPDPKPGRK